MKIACRQTGVIDFLLGEEEFPIDLGEDAPVEEYNNYILELADWTGKNALLLGSIQTTCEEHIREKIKIVDNVSEALKILDNECTDGGVGLALELYRKLKEYSFRNITDFPAFVRGFSKLFNDLNRLRGPYKFSNYQKCLYFIGALLVEHFGAWIESANNIALLVGYGLGPDLGFDTLAIKAENYWNTIQRSHNADLGLAESRLFAAKRTFSNRSRSYNIPPLGQLVGAKDQPC